MRLDSAPFQVSAFLARCPRLRLSLRPPWRVAGWIAAVCFLLWCISLQQVLAEEVDLELVLAMDGSGSISESEYIFQLEGTARAFEDPAIRTAIRSGPLGRIAVSVVIWSDAAFQKAHSGWYLLDDDASIVAFANRIRNFHQHTGRKFGIGGGGTGIGEGIRYSINEINSNAYFGLRRVVDVSGDGVETDPWFQKAVMLPQARQIAANENVVVNGLPILNRDFPHLDGYYRAEVISGPGAFVVVADGFEDFGRAIHEKLWREVSYKVAAYEDGPLFVHTTAVDTIRQLTNLSTPRKFR